MSVSEDVRKEKKKLRGKEECTEKKFLPDLLMAERNIPGSHEEGWFKVKTTLTWEAQQ